MVFIPISVRTYLSQDSNPEFKTRKIEVYDSVTVLAVLDPLTRSSNSYIKEKQSDIIFGTSILN